MRQAAVLGRGVGRGAAPTGLPAVSLQDAASGRYDRLLVIGSLAEVATVAAACPESAIAFAGRHELSALFALDSDPTKARRRLDGGTVYSADLARLHLGNKEMPFLGHIVAGAGARLRTGFPWAGRSAAIRIVAERTLEVSDARTVVVSNIQRLGISALAPRAAVNDGRLDVMVLSGGAVDLIRLRPALRHGLHERSPLVRRATITSCEAILPDHWRVSADGMAIGRGSFRVTITPSAVTLLV